ncbi:hypothetical protein F5Y18DRAFT_363880 [Xylariaceae sp. FL1019]|nr:hypothetical protein F5Y18DRAFT_363880 [Xylariaceae sp. FL1019]
MGNAIRCCWHQYAWFSQTILPLEPFPFELRLRGRGTACLTLHALTCLIFEVPAPGLTLDKEQKRTDPRSRYKNSNAMSVQMAASMKPQLRPRTFAIVLYVDVIARTETRRNAAESGSSEGGSRSQVPADRDSLTDPPPAELSVQGNSPLPCQYNRGMGSSNNK